MLRVRPKARRQRRWTVQPALRQVTAEVMAKFQTTLIAAPASPATHHTEWSANNVVAMPILPTAPTEQIRQNDSRPQRNLRPVSRRSREVTALLSVKLPIMATDRKSTRLNSSHPPIS